MRLFREFIVYIFLFCTFLISGAVSYAQISNGGTPRGVAVSQLKSKAKIPTFKTMSVDAGSLLEEDRQAPIPERFSVFEDLIIDIREEAVEIDLPSEQGRLFLYQIESADARSLQLFFENFLLPDGGELFIYNYDQTIVRGAFTSSNNNQNNQLMIAEFFDNEIIIEYFEPYNAAFEGFIELGAVGLGYKDPIIEKVQIDPWGYVGVNEAPGEDWQNEKHSVCKISYRKGNGGYICTGALLNNSRSDGTPYFLTANHCVSDDESASTLVAYFNLENYSGDYRLAETQTLSGGSDLLLSSNITDFSLLKLKVTPPVSYQPYYAPWNATNDQDSGSVGIHHPSGLPKRMSIDNSPPATHDKTIYWDGGGESAPNTHWRVQFDHGRTAGGSSGSPLFNTDRHQVIGQLHGGSDDDYYGKLSRTFDIDLPKSVSSFLSPDDMAQDQLEDGYYPPETLPDPQFIPEFAYVCVGIPIQFTGMSAFDPLSWTWSFSPNTVSYTNGTDSSSKAPVVKFESSDSYTVTLAVTNAAGTTSRSFPGSIMANNNLDLVIQPYFETDSCVNTFDSLLLEVYGAQEYLWRFSNDDEENFYIVDDTVNPVTIKMNSSPGASRDLSVILIGSHGHCSREVTHTLPLFQQNNDSIKDAVQIFEGQSEVFSNKCAGFEDNEPIPPITSCTGNSWCDEFGTGEDILGNSVWFYFIPEVQGKYRISTQGMDNQIAIYKTGSVDDLLSDDYELIGANDDVSDKNANPSMSVLLSAGEQYLIQSDGSAGNVSGNFYFNVVLLEELAIDIAETVPALRIYPQPISETLRVEYEGFLNSDKIAAEVFNISGSKIYSSSYENPSSRIIEINSAQWKKGIYFVRFLIDGAVVTEKVVKF